VTDQPNQYRLSVIRYGPTYVIQAFGNDFHIEVGSFQSHDESTLSGIDVLATAILLWTGVDIAQLINEEVGTEITIDIPALLGYQIVRFSGSILAHLSKHDFDEFETTDCKEHRYLNQNDWLNQTIALYHANRTGAGR
jgi:hypothetical protein